MLFRMDQLLRSLATGLDAVEKEVVGATTNHGKRIAVLTAAMGNYLGWGNEQITSITACGLLHDNALTESLAENQRKEIGTEFLAAHCIKGERNAAHLPFPSDVKDFIKYHHECANGWGPFGLRGEDTPMGAQLIAVADHFDVEYKIKDWQETDIGKLMGIIRQERGKVYTEAAADALLAVMDSPLLRSLRDEHIDKAFDASVPVWNADVDAARMMEIAETVAAITDYKSKYTAKHSLQIANRAYWMANFYGFDKETRAKIYLAASLHDVGKLVTPVHILDKPGKLTDEEYEIIKKHVYWSYIMLKDVDGFDGICRWAVTHHRKQNGTGYPDLPAKYLEMDFVSRMMTCIDIYQAVREARPYHPSRTHRETMSIMWEMVGRGEIDRQITEDLDKEMAQFTGEDGDVPKPTQPL
ncbi:MAG: HD domain-containing protein [Clostridiales bacterium]|jgi:HD-GYP domain-containing protein (c-di-GMP phosphodiesterase class II)|nr:HD domain-containing protein [Clostridiales bacterium]